jgi:hypothetical protein
LSSHYTILSMMQIAGVRERCDGAPARLAPSPAGRIRAETTLPGCLLFAKLSRLVTYLLDPATP